MSYEASSNQGTLPSTPSNAFNPPNSYHVTDASGTFSDAGLLGGSNLVNESVIGVAKLNPVAPESTNLYAPLDFSLFPVANGVVVGPNEVSKGLHYDNLLFPGGSPRSASDYPFHGGLFDIYGLIFTLANGESVNLWSNGDMGNGVSYGVAVTDGTDVLSSKGGVLLSVVPLPPSAPLFGVALFALGAAGLGSKRRKTAAV